jgi:hypothetical protein
MFQFLRMNSSVDPTRFIGQDLVLKATIIGGSTAPEDYVAVSDGLTVARIVRQQKSFGRSSWDWTITGPYLPPAMGQGNGSAASKDEAKAAVRAVFDCWLVFYSANPDQAVWFE